MTDTAPLTRDFIYAEPGTDAHAQLVKDLSAYIEERLCADFPSLQDKNLNGATTKLCNAHLHLCKANVYLSKTSTVFLYSKKINDVVLIFEKNGLTIDKYLPAALKQPQLFCQSPDTIAANINGVVAQFKDRGLTVEKYLPAALKQPPLFYQPHSLLWNTILGYPALLSFADENFILRMDHSMRSNIHHNKFSLLTKTKSKVLKEYQETIGDFSLQTVQENNPRLYNELAARNLWPTLKPVKKLEAA